MLSLIVLQNALALGSAKAFASTRLPANPGTSPLITLTSRPYLKVIAVLPLRFNDEPAPIAVPVASEESSSIKETSVSGDPALTPTESDVQILPRSSMTDESRPSAAALLPPARILPDDIQPTARPEDFLPFFRFPTENDVTVIVPAVAPRPASPGQLPPSSATYQQR